MQKLDERRKSRFDVGLGLLIGLIAGTFAANPLFNWDLPDGAGEMFGALIGAAAAVIGSEWLRKRHDDLQLQRIGELVNSLVDDFVKNCQKALDKIPAANPQLDISEEITCIPGQAISLARDLEILRPLQMNTDGEGMLLALMLIRSLTGIEDPRQFHHMNTAERLNRYKRLTDAAIKSVEDLLAHYREFKKS